MRNTVELRQIEVWQSATSTPTPSPKHQGGGDEARAFEYFTNRCLPEIGTRFADDPQGRPYGFVVDEFAGRGRDLMWKGHRGVTSATPR